MAFRRVLPMAAVMALICGCQSYNRQPLGLANYASEWADRSLDVESIQRYATLLSDASAGEAMFDSSDGLSLYEAEAVALHFNPQLRVARSAADVPLAAARESGWWPDPQFEAEVLRFVNRGSKSRFKLNGPSIDGINAGGIETTPIGLRRVQGDYIDDPMIVGGSLSITIPISGRLKVEQDLRWSEHSAAWRRILLQEWRLITELRAAWLKWSWAEERLRISRDYVKQLEPIAGMAEQLVSAGEMKPTEGRLLQIELARRRASIYSFEREQNEARLDLLALMGLAPDVAILLHPDLSIIEVAVQPEDRRNEVVAHHPRVKSIEADYETAEQQLRLELRRQYPDLNLGPSYSFEEGFSRLGLGIGFPIPLWNRNREAIAEAFAFRDSVRARSEAVVQSILSKLAQVERRLNYASQQRRAILENVAPLVTKQVEDSRTLLGLGEVDVLLLRDALTGSFETKLALLDATLAEGRSASELQQMLRPQWITRSQLPSEEED